MENGTYEQIVTYLEKELELNGLEAPDELQLNTVSQNPANTKAGRPKRTRHQCKKNQEITEISVLVSLTEKAKKQTENTKKIPRNRKGGPNNSIPSTKNNNNHNNYKTSNRDESKPKTV